MRYWVWGAVLMGAVLMLACGDDDDDAGSAAQRRGVGAACTADPDCEEPGQRCLPFKGGYCGVAGCQTDANCPSGSACVTHDDGSNYCFLVCREKPECNIYRPADVEASCVSSIDFTDGKGLKACVPPSGS
jgi:hypothetical protein